MPLLSHLAARLIGVPLAIHRPKLDTILAVLGERVGLQGLPAPPLHQPTPRPAAQGHAGIAVIPIHGSLMRRTSGLQADSGLVSYEGIAQQLDAALARPDIAGVLLDIDSPGGEASGVFDLADRIRAAGQVKPVWAMANDQALSAGYALASAANRVVVSRTSAVGSIGVIAMHVDQSARDAQQGLRYTAVFAGDRKTDLNPHAPLTEDAHAALQAEVNRVYGLFVATVAAHRGLDPQAVRSTQAGLFFGADAVAAGLADQLGTFDDALAALSASLSSPSVARPLAARAGHSSTTFMDQQVQAIPTAPSVAPPVAAAPAAPAAALAAPTLTSADAVDIAQTCQLAGRPDLTLGFLMSGATPTSVRQQLLAARAEASPVITSHIGPEAHQAARAAANPLLEGARARAAAAASRGRA